VAWSVEGRGGEPVSIERRVDGGPWVEVAHALTDPAGAVAYDDGDVTPGKRHGYVLVLRDGPDVHRLGEVEITVPARSLAITAVTPNPTPHDVVVAFDLPSGGPAEFRLLDLAGRRIVTVPVGSFGPGSHTLNLSSGIVLEPGVYVVQLVQGGGDATRKVAILP
jgi:hypothetical protein